MKFLDEPNYSTKENNNVNKSKDIDLRGSPNLGYVLGGVLFP